MNKPLKNNIWLNVKYVLLDLLLYSIVLLNEKLLLHRKHVFVKQSK